MSADDMSEQTRALGFPAVAAISHDAIRLPDGNTVVVTNIQQPANQGRGMQTITGNMIIVLDRNWKVIWAWNPFDKLDVKRKVVAQNYAAQIEAMYAGKSRPGS